MEKTPVDPPTSHEIYNLVQNQFGPVASSYTTSVGHANPEALQQVVSLAQPQPGERALDVATGAGHTALALATFVAEVVAYDLTPQMLEETARNAAERGIINLTTQAGRAEELPFPDRSFDIVTVRIASHHFAGIKQAVKEMARVVKQGGRVVVVDTTVPENKELDYQINHIEKLRDPSHVRNYSLSEWKAMLEEAGLNITYAEVDYYTEQGPMLFSTWTGRIRTTAAAVKELETLFRTASPALVDALKIETDPNEIYFYLPKLTIAATRS